MTLHVSQKRKPQTSITLVKKHYFLFTLQFITAFGLCGISLSYFFTIIKKIAMTFQKTMLVIYFHGILKLLILHYEGLQKSIIFHSIKPIFLVYDAP